MNIRLAIKSDLSALIELDHIAREDCEGRREFIADVIERGECHVACADEKIVGYIVLNYSFYGNGCIDMLYLNEEYRGKGIGGELIDHIEAICAKEKLFTSTNLSNLRMQKLMKKKNFMISGVIHNLDEGDPEIVYFKRLKKEEQDDRSGTTLPGKKLTYLTF